MLLIAPARGFPWSRAWLLALRRPLAEEAEEGLRRAGERRNARSPPPPPSIPPPSPPPRLPLLPRMRLSRPRAGPPCCQLALGLVGRASLAALVVARPTARRHVAALAVRLLLLILVVMTCILVAPSKPSWCG